MKIQTIFILIFCIFNKHKIMEILLLNVIIHALILVRRVSDFAR